MATSAIKSQGTKFYIGDSEYTNSPTNYIQVGEIQTVSGPSGQATVIDATHLDSDAKEKLMGLPDEGQVTIGGNYVDTDSGQDAMLEARAAQEKRDFKIVLSNGAQFLFQGFVLSFNIDLGVDDKVSFSSTIEISGAVSRV